MEVSDPRSHLAQLPNTSSWDANDSWPLPQAKGKVFFLARHGLRSPSHAGEPFLGYEAPELFWRDVFELVHERDLPTLEGGISTMIERPGTSSSVEVRLLDASGMWRWVEASIHNVLESPGDEGLLIVDVRELPETLETG